MKYESLVSREGLDPQIIEKGGFQINTYLAEKSKYSDVLDAGTTIGMERLWGWVKTVTGGIGLGGGRIN